MLKQFPAKQKNQKTMKKVFLTLALVLTTVVASAQWYVGGGLGFSKQDKATSYEIKPEVGYKINDNWTVGAEVVFGKVKDTPDAFNGTTIAFNPYARYTFLTAGEFSMFAEAYASVQNKKPEGGDGETGFALGVRPGVAYNIDENWTIAAKLGEGLNYQDKKYVGAEKSKFALQLTNGLEFSLYYNF